MAYVAPNSIIKLIRGVKNDPLYENSIWFANVTDQYNYFNSKVKYTFTEQSYQRKNRGYIKLKALFDNVVDCNYLMYQNSAFGNKWFYAFITNCEYINDSVVEIQFEIDVLQTYISDFEMGQCYIERTHVSNDNIGLHTVPEPIESWKNFYSYQGKFIEDGQETFDRNNWLICVCGTVNSVNLQPVDAVGGGGGAYMYSGLVYNFFTNDTDATTFIANCVMAGKQDAIVSVFMCPGYFVMLGTNGPSYKIRRNVTTPKNYSWTYTRYDGKTGPRNNKLYSRQFNYLLITNGMSGDAIFDYERFTDAQNCTFSLNFCIQPNIEFSLIPTYYQGGNGDLNKLTLTGTPQSAWMSDAFQNWLAQNKYRITFDATESIVGSLGASATGGLSLGATAKIAGGNLYNTIKSDIIEGLRQENLPPQSHGHQEGGVAISDETFGFNIYNVFPMAESAAMIDDFFDMFGYAVKKVGKPYWKNRENWTYVKTIGAICLPLHGKSIPADDARKIQAIYDNGIRWWVNGDNIGNYNLSNLPTPS